MSKNAIQSSLKNIKFDELTADQIVKKYEEVLNSREKQVYELSAEVGKVNQKLENLREKLEDSKTKNAQLKIILEEKEVLLKQELDNKEILFMQLSKKEKECDEIQEKINNLKKNKNNPKDKKEKNKEEKDKEEKINDNKKEENKIEEKKIENKDKNEDKKSDKDIESDPQSLAKEKINQLTNKGEGMKKINFAELIKKKQEKKRENPE